MTNADQISSLYYTSDPPVGVSKWEYFIVDPMYIVTKFPNSHNLPKTHIHEQAQQENKS